MRRPRITRLVAPLLAFALLAAPLVPVASAQTAFTVLAGNFSEPDVIVVNAFLPEDVTVNEGDTITWPILGFHTVTFPGADGIAPPFLIPDPANPQGMIFNPEAAFPTEGDTYDGTEMRNSGVPMAEGEEPATYSLTFTAAGTYTYFCVVHPGMVGTVTVQAAGSAYPMTPDEVTAAGDAASAADVAAVQAEVATISGPDTQPVLAGAVSPDGDAETLLFHPSATTVQVGDSVTWDMEAESREIHTVTFLSGAEPFSIEVITENPAGPPTIAVNPLAAAPAGGPEYDGTGLVNSGIMLAGDSYSLTFTEAGTYAYYCAVHGDIMSGTVTVEAATAPIVAPPVTTPPTPPTTPPATTPPALPPTGQAPGVQSPAVQAPKVQIP